MPSLAAEPSVQEVTRAQFQRLLGRSRADVDRLLALGLPHRTVGKGRGSEIRIALGPALAWLAARFLDPEGSTDPPLAVSKRRLAALQAEAAALKLEQARGNLMEREGARRFVQARARGLRDSWMSWPLRASPIIAAELGVELGPVFAALDAAVRQHLTEQAEPQALAADA